MNLLYTLTAYPPSTGGAQLHIHQLARQLSSQNTVQVVTQWDKNRTDWLLGTTLRAPFPSHSYKINNIPVQCITIPKAARRELLPWVIAYFPLQGIALNRISKVIAKEIDPWSTSADLIHNCRIGREGLSFASFQIARRRDIPFILTPVHHPRWSGWMHRYYKQLYRQADILIALTEAERRMLVGLGVEEKKVFVTGIGPILAESGDGERFREKYHLYSNPLILFLGQKYEYKGLVALLDGTSLIWKRVPEAKFVFIGPRTSYSERLFREVKDSRILELDTVSLQDKTDALAACTILCVASSQESFGGVYTEAWCFTKPVIGCNIPAVAEVINDGENGYLIDQNPVQIAERIIYLLENPGEAQRLGENGRQKVEARFTWPKLAEMTEKIYLDCLAGK